MSFLCICREKGTHGSATVVQHPAVPPPDAAKPRYYFGAGLTLDAGISSVSKVLASMHSPDVNPINHVLIVCQENRSFDHYFGYYPKAGSFGVPAHYSQPDGKGGTVTPHHDFFPVSLDPSHSWQSIHSEWNHGAMNGFYTTDGSTALSYYDGSDLAYYYALAGAFTLCGNYFCSVLGPSNPNLLSLVSGTAGGIRPTPWTGVASIGQSWWICWMRIKSPGSATTSVLAQVPRW